MTRHRHILEGIDACRPGSDDLHASDLTFLADELARDPQSRELYDRVQQVDAAVAAAFSDVPVPEGLAARILARLPAPQAKSAPSDDPQSASARTSTALPSPVSRRFSRRSLAAAAIGMAVAAGVALVVVNLPSGPEVNQDNVADLAREFYQAERRHPPGLGLLVQQQPAPRGYPLSTSVLVPGDVRWRRVSGLFGRDGVAYDLPNAGGGQVLATLYVVPIPSTLTGLRNTPPYPPATTAGVAIGAWQEKQKLFVLVVNGGAGQYQALIRPVRLG